jgi:hypothetical protein
LKFTHSMDLLHLAERQLVQPVRFRQVASLVLFDKLQRRTLSRFLGGSSTANHLLQSSHLVTNAKLAWCCSLSRAIRLLSRPENKTMFPSSQCPAKPLIRRCPEQPQKGQSNHFLPNSLKVDPPTGAADRGPAMSHTVNVICALRGRSQYRIGNDIHSFHLHNAFRIHDMLCNGLGRTCMLL